MATVFTKIINGEIPCYKIAEDENYFAFLDINPLRAGHTLVVPKKETDYIFDLEDDQLAGIMLFSKKVGSDSRFHMHTFILYLWIPWKTLISEIQNLNSLLKSLKI
jgi:diadenosine tetraphosphate (Ap4A) HIT family hydrolase